jgi:hypothetical protein
MQKDLPYDSTGAIFPRLVGLEFTSSTKLDYRDPVGSKDTPAISDESMSEWMAYLYQQWPKPTNATGVPVFLQAMKSDGSLIDITQVTSDIMGHYEYTWTPPDKDTYKILATFEGSKSSGLHPHKLASQ